MQPVPPTTFINYRCIPQAKRRFSILKYDTTASVTSIQAFPLQKRPQLMISIANSQNSKTLWSQVALSEAEPPSRQVLPYIEFKNKYRIDHTKNVLPHIDTAILAAKLPSRLSSPSKEYVKSPTCFIKQQDRY